MNGELITKLINSFPNSFINNGGEFIAEEKSNTYFNLKNCKNELEVKCKLLEWCSRTAYKGQLYEYEKKNKELREFMLNGINQFLDTDFSQDDMEQIYTYLGNAVNHERTVIFVESGYDMNLLIGQAIENERHTN